MPVSRVGKRRQVVLPKAVCEAVGLVEGDFVEVSTRKGRVEIQPKRLVDLEDTLTPEEEKIVAKGFRQLKRGQFVTWDQLKNELGR
ncbi:MAG: AbrB/MazE/SpoVT family DNA-binding domain-containing protein [Acidobacteria bacterium]|nr:AbrB/MazE/SpoVT family DNA-binding domain-containing protein [Acidobacteriota bacterium]